MRGLPVAMLGLVAACMNADAINAKSVADVRQRAAFDLRCDGQALQVTPLAKHVVNADLVSQYGVEGCGHHAVYVDTGSAGWVMNTRDGSAETVPPAAKAAPAPQAAPAP